MLREEKKKFKRLQKEVDKMAKLMGDADDDDEEEEKEEEEEEEEEETDSEEESESEESEEEESETDDEEAPLPKRKNNLQVSYFLLSHYLICLNLNVSRIGVSILLV